MTTQTTGDAAPAATVRTDVRRPGTRGSGPAHGTVGATATGGDDA